MRKHGTRNYGEMVLKHTILFASYEDRSLETVLSAQPMSLLYPRDSLFAALEAVLGLAVGFG